MQTIYGVRMITLNDIIDNPYVGRPQRICQYMKEEVLSKGVSFLGEFTPKIVVDTRLEGNFTLYNMIVPYKLIFIPLDIIEEHLIYDAILGHLKNVQRKITSLRADKKIEKMRNTFDSRLYDCRSKYLSEKDVASASCCMFIFEQDKIVDVYTTLPSDILGNVLFKAQEYECEHCKKIKTVGNRSLEDMLPDMRYEVVDGKIFYYCNDCAKQQLKHVGE